MPCIKAETFSRRNNSKVLSIRTNKTMCDLGLSWPDFSMYYILPNDLFTTFQVHSLPFFSSSSKLFYFFKCLGKKWFWLETGNSSVTCKRYSKHLMGHFFLPGRLLIFWLYCIRRRRVHFSCHENHLIVFFIGCPAT